MTDETQPEESAPTPGTTLTEVSAATTTGEAAGAAKLRQTVEIIDVGPCKKHIKVIVDRNDIDALFNDKFSELVVDTPVAGFRPGKAPRKIIERRFQREVNDQVKAEVLLQSLEQLAEDYDVAPLSAPDIDPTKIEIPKQGPFVYEFEVEVRPQFDLPNYKGLRLRRPVRTFTDADVAQEEQRLLAPYGQMVPKPDSAGGEPTVDRGDYIIADVTTRHGDRVLGISKEARIRVGIRLAFKDGVAERFGEQLRGAKPGASRVVDIALSDSVADASLRGKTVQATVEVKDIKILRLPELTHELLHEFGVHTPEQFRELTRLILERRLEYAQRQAAREQVLAQIAVAGAWELPQDLLLRQARKVLARRVMEMRSSGISEEEIKGRQRLLQQDVLQSTALALKEQFVLQKIADVEKLDVGDDDITDEIERIAAQNDESPRRVRARLEKEDLLDALAAEIVERKALDLVLQNADYEDVPVGDSEEGAVATVEEQAVAGEMHDPTAEPPEQAENTGEAAMPNS